MLYQKKIILSLIICAVCAYNCSRNQGSSIQKQLFDLNWKFYQGNDSSANQININDQHWINLDLPHDWSKKDKLRTTTPEERVDPVVVEDGWYRKHFIIPKKWENKNIALEFEYMSSYAEIFINGTSLGTPSEKDNSFHTDISPFLNHTGNNVIAVQIKRSDITTGKEQADFGIFGHVWLIIKDSND